MSNYLNRKDINTSLRFGFLGIGMGGCAIAAECADIKTGVENNRYPYTALLLNTNTKDFDKVKASNPNIIKFPLKGFEKGAGRNIEVGENAFLAHKDAVIKQITQHFSDRDFIWLVCGLGGGTGTGSVIEAIKTLHGNGFKKRFGLILTLPRNKEGSTVLSNALERLQKIAKAMKGLGSILLVDNQKLYDQYIEDTPNGSITDYLNFSNEYVANTLHELNVVTSSFEPYADNHFDASEFENILKTPGVISLSKVSIPANSIDLSNQSSYLTSFQNSIEEGILSDGYNFKKASRAAVSVIANKNAAERVFKISFVNQIEENIDELAPIAGEKPIALYEDKETRDVNFYSVFAGLDLPKRIAELVEENDRLQSIQFEEDNEAMVALSSFKRKSETEDVDDLNSLLDDSDELDFGDDDDTTKKEKSDSLYQLLDD